MFHVCLLCTSWKEEYQQGRKGSFAEKRKPTIPPLDTSYFLFPFYFSFLGFIFCFFCWKVIDPSHMTYAVVLHWFCDTSGHHISGFSLLYPKILCRVEDRAPPLLSVLFVIWGFVKRCLTLPSFGKDVSRRVFSISCPIFCSWPIFGHLASLCLNSAQHTLSFFPRVWSLLNTPSLVIFVMHLLSPSFQGLTYSRENRPAV